MSRGKTPRVLMFHADGTREEYAFNPAGPGGGAWERIDRHGEHTHRWWGWRAVADRVEAFIARESA